MTTNRRTPRHVERDWHRPDRKRCGACRVDGHILLDRTSRIIHHAYQLAHDGKSAPPLFAVSESIEEVELGTGVPVHWTVHPRARRRRAA